MLRCKDATYLFFRSKMNHPWFGPSPILALLATKEGNASILEKPKNCLFSLHIKLKNSCNNKILSESQNILNTNILLFHIFPPDLMFVSPQLNNHAMLNL